MTIVSVKVLHYLLCFTPWNFFLSEGKLSSVLHQLQHGMRHGLVSGICLPPCFSILNLATQEPLCAQLDLVYMLCVFSVCSVVSWEKLLFYKTVIISSSTGHTEIITLSWVKREQMLLLNIGSGGTDLIMEGSNTLASLKLHHIFECYSGTSTR